MTSTSKESGEQSLPSRDDELFLLAKEWITSSINSKSYAIPADEEIRRFARFLAQDHLKTYGGPPVDPLSDSRRLAQELQASLVKALDEIAAYTENRRVLWDDEIGKINQALEDVRAFTESFPVPKTYTWHDLARLIAKTAQTMWRDEKKTPRSANDEAPITQITVKALEYLGYHFSGAAVSDALYDRKRKNPIPTFLRLRK
ncbi:hypothetical protein [Acidocella sp. KAb 2-4]|uniref:hypothetical protein n=1 Tax=Acidocella sp. KAb 2-4 TaxID=2885158 RepID=UPI001D07B154|nr:hypothetical protein [Acidocella sp. KAb 2-4]MCB5945384.1 hypothetical protein [Acidocella sp. KAb 2-4]